MKTHKLNRCPRCGGYMFLDEWVDNWYFKCLQCSYQRELETQAVSRLPSNLKQKRDIPMRGNHWHVVPV